MTAHTVDENEKACIEADMERLNQSTLKELQNAMKDVPPAGDLWPVVRKVNADYRSQRRKLVEALEYGNDSEDQASPDSQPTQRVENKLQHAVPREGDIVVFWPLEPEVESLLCDNSLGSGNGGKASISRSKVSRALKRGELLYQYFNRAVVRLTSSIVVKINKSKDITELSNLYHIRSTSQTIPVPGPLGMFSIAHFCYHFTTYLPGIPLDRIWGNLTSSQKEEVRKRLDHLFTELRNLPLPSKYLGVGSPPICKHHRRWTEISSSPIVDEKQFNDFLLRRSHSSPNYIDYLTTSLPTDHRIVMTHGDLHPRNLLVHQEGDSLDIAGVVDWEFGGGYPEYWEYVQALKSSFITEGDDWLSFLPEKSIGKYFDAFARDSVVGKMVS